MMLLSGSYSYHAILYVWICMGAICARNCDTDVSTVLSWNSVKEVSATSDNVISLNISPIFTCKKRIPVINIRIIRECIGELHVILAVWLHKIILRQNFCGCTFTGHCTSYINYCFACQIQLSPIFLFIFQLHIVIYYYIISLTCPLVSSHSWECLSPQSNPLLWRTSAASETVGCDLNTVLQLTKYKSQGKGFLRAL